MAGKIVWLNITLGYFLLFLSSLESLMSFNFSDYCLANVLAIMCNQDYAFDREKPFYTRGSTYNRYRFSSNSQTFDAIPQMQKTIYSIKYKTLGRRTMNIGLRERKNYA